MKHAMILLLLCSVHPQHNVVPVWSLLVTGHWALSIPLPELRQQVPEAVFVVNRQ